jgi:hypothetical protein
MVTLDLAAARLERGKGNYHAASLI